jgi:hypothetical protein
MNTIDLYNLEVFLTKQADFIYEAELIKEFFPNFSFHNSTGIELYRVHFILFHHLYLLKPILAEKGLYLHIHFMRIGVIKYPPANCCRYFNQETLSFCSRHITKTVSGTQRKIPFKTEGGASCCAYKGGSSNYCPEHSATLLENIDSNALFYLDRTNYDYFTEEILENWYSGMNNALRNHEYFKKALTLLNLPENFDIFTLKTNYRQLAKRYHPDVKTAKNEDYDSFLEINRAYQYLLKCCSGN